MPPECARRFTFSSFLISTSAMMNSLNTLLPAELPEALRATLVFVRH